MSEISGVINQSANLDVGINQENELNVNLMTTGELNGTIQTLDNLSGVLNKNGELLANLDFPIRIGGYIVYDAYINNDGYLMFVLYDNSEINVGYVKGDNLINESINSLTYNVDGSLNIITTDSGTKTMVYDNNILIGIIGTGIYPSKNFTYADGKLIATEVVL